MTRSLPFSSMRHLSAAALTLVTALFVAAAPTSAQTPPPFPLTPACTPTSPSYDGWPVAATDTVTLYGASVEFSGALLLANDSGNGLTVTGAGPTSSGGGSVSSGSSYRYTPGPGYSGGDVFTYQITDSAGQSVVGLVKVVQGELTTVAVPDLSGKSQGSAESDIDDADLVPGTVGSAYSISVPVGKVVSQDPPAGTTVPVGSIVSFTLSLGPASVTVPPLGGLTEGDAEGALSGVGLLKGTVTSAYSSSVPAGKVISQLPAAGSSAYQGTAVDFVLSLGIGSPTVLSTISVDGIGRVVTAPFSVPNGALLVAFAASDGPPAVGEQRVTISGGGLAWTRVRRVNARLGVSEIWAATAPADLTGVRIASRQAGGTTFHQSLTVVVFEPGSSIGASAIQSGITGAPSITLIPQASGSLVYAVGNDWDNSIPRVLPAGQTMVHEWIDTSVHDTFWVQAAVGATTAGVPVTLNATSPTTDQWNLAIVEIKK